MNRCRTGILLVGPLLLAGCSDGPDIAPRGATGVPFAVFGVKKQKPPEKVRENPAKSSGTAEVVPVPEEVPSLVGGVPTHPRGLRPPATLSFAPAPIEPMALSNGAKVFIAEDHTVPLVSLRVYLRTGVLEEPAEKAGLAALAGSALRAGGAGDREPAALDALLEDSAISVESSVGRDFGTLSLTCRVQDLSKGLEVLRDVLEKPRFDAQRLALVRAQMMEGIRRRQDDPEELASVAFGKLLYGADSPWCREATLATLQGITREDVEAFHRDHILPCLWSVAASGDVDAFDLSRRMESALGSLPRRDGTGPALPAAPAIQAPHVVLIPKDVNQASLFVGHAGLPNLLDGKPHPDRYALQVFNYILGGAGFSSRLTQEIRVKRGLAYGVWSAIPMENGRGAVEMGSQTKTESAKETLGLLRSVMAQALEQGVTPKEVALAKEAMTNAFVFRTATASARVQNAALYDFMGLPPDYLSRYVENLKKVSSDDVLRAARAHCHPDQLSIAVCGVREALEPALAEFGKVEVPEAP